MLSGKFHSASFTGLAAESRQTRTASVCVCVCVSEYILEGPIYSALDLIRSHLPSSLSKMTAFLV